MDKLETSDPQWVYDNAQVIGDLHPSSAGRGGKCVPSLAGVCGHVHNRVSVPKHQEEHGALGENHVPPHRLCQLVSLYRDTKVHGADI